MTVFRDVLYHRIVTLYGHNHEVTNAFYELCENEDFPNDALETLVKAHEEYNQYNQVV